MFRKIEFEVFFLIAVAIGVGIIFSLYTKNKNAVNHIPLPVSPGNGYITPSPAQSEEGQFQISPDGTKKVTMTTQINKDFTKTYIFTTSDSDGKNKKTALQIVLGKDSMHIPFNTWSPDNRYFFVIHKSPSKEEAIVARADGKPIAEDQLSYNITDNFEARDTGNIYDETTGWASETLLIINTKTKDNTKGPSYWFEVPSKAIIALSTEF